MFNFRMRKQLPATDSPDWLLAINDQSEFRREDVIPHHALAALPPASPHVPRRTAAFEKSRRAVRAVAAGTELQGQDNGLQETLQVTFLIHLESLAKRPASPFTSPAMAFPGCSSNPRRYRGSLHPEPSFRSCRIHDRIHRDIRNHRSVGTT